MNKILFFAVILFIPGLLIAQQLATIEKYMWINAKADAPLYTTYAATMARSSLYGDKAYKMDYYSDCRTVNYSSDHTGSFYCIWKIDEMVIDKISEFFQKPVVIFSFPDMMVMEYEPFRSIHVKETFLVYSSTIALVDMEVRNASEVPHEISVYPVLDNGDDSLEIVRYDSVYDGYITRSRDFFTSSQKVCSHGGYYNGNQEFYKAVKSDFYSTSSAEALNSKDSGCVNFISLHLKKRLRPGETTSFRYFRGSGQKENAPSLLKEIGSLKTAFLRTFFEDNLMLYAKVSRISFRSEKEKLVYIGALNLARSCTFPEHPGQLLSWINWEVYKINGDREFLKEAYLSGTGYMNWFRQNGDSDHASPGLTLMLIKEGRSLARMAKELGHETEAITWQKKADQVQKLVTRVTDSSKYQVTFEVPVIPGCSNDKPFNANPDSCGKVKGAVWIPWDYMVYSDMKSNGYYEPAHQLADKLVSCAIAQLSRYHNFPEYFCPGPETNQGLSDYIWDSILAKLLIEENTK